MSSPDDLMPPSGSSRPGPDDVTMASGGPSRTAPSRIGRYTVLRVIASGGMGTVLEALQDDPRRSVAIKIMKAGLDSPEALRRFQFEAQLLARLRHPGIAQVYEAGTQDDGSGPVPFYAMEYIPNGRPITEYAVDRKLDLRARLELFARVCDAVHHGHQRGIIHRDLKPGNIVVDSEGNPKVIDFGVARAADSDSALSVFQTQAGQLIGSIAYMSPEQIDGDPRDLDARSDVYALGVVLYELIAGRLPYDLSTAKIYDAARVVREQDPARLRAVVPDLPAEVETVVRKALEKDRERRYQSAHALADDLRRFLSGQTVTASPPSAAYQMRVFARRHKAMLAGIAAVFAVLVVAVVAVSSMYVRAERLRKVAEHESARSQAAVDFLTESLASLEPVGYDHEPTMSDLLQRLESNIEGAFPDDPLVEAKLRKTIGWAYMSRFDWAGIERHLTRSLDLRVKGGAGKDPEALEILQMLATVYDVTGETGREIDMRREAAAVCLALHGERDSLTVVSRFDLVNALCNGSRFQEAMDEATATASLAAQVLGPEHETTLACRAQVGWLQLAQGELAAAEATNGALLDTSRRRMGESAKLTRRVRSQLAGTLIAEGKLDDAEKLYGEAAVPADLGIERRYQGDPKIAGEAQMLVFWETWCPFSQRTVPSLEKPHLRYPELDVVGITRASPPSTDEKVLKFIEEKGISFPIVRSTRMPWAYFDVPGTPFVVLARKRRVLWENSMQAPDVVLERLLRGVMERDRG